MAYYSGMLYNIIWNNLLNVYFILFFTLFKEERIYIISWKTVSKIRLFTISHNFKNITSRILHARKCISIDKEEIVFKVSVNSIRFIRARHVSSHIKFYRKISRNPSSLSDERRLTVWPGRSLSQIESYREWQKRDWR